MVVFRFLLVFPFVKFLAQVLLFVLAMIAYFAIESSSNPSIKFSFAIVWLGFGIAISACLPVFFAYVIVSRVGNKFKEGTYFENHRVTCTDTVTRYGVNWLLVLSEILAIMSLIIIPVTEGNIFNRNIMF